MRTPPLFPLVILFLLTACERKPPTNAAAQAEAAEARMDAEAARMVAAADSVRASSEQTADSLRGLQKPQSKSPSR